MKQGIDFTTGKIYFPLLKFAFPIFLANLLQNTYGAVDLMIIGFFCEAEDVSAVANAAQVMFATNMLIVGLAFGITILLGQKIGAKQLDDCGEVLGAGISLFILISLCMTFSLSFFSSDIVSLLNTPKDAIIACINYILINAYGFIFIVAYNLFGSIFRAIGDSKTPLITVAIACFTNIILDLIFIGYFGLGVEGAAYATIISQAFSVFFSLLYIRRQEMPFVFSLKNIKFHKAYIKSIIVLGAPLAMQFFFAQISFLIITSIVNTFGLVASAGVGIAQRIVSFIMLVPTSLAQATASVTAQNYGAKNIERATKSFNYAIMTSFGISIFIAYYCYFHGDNLARLFTQDAKVIEACWLYMQGYSIDVLLTSFFFVFAGFFNGCGQTTVVMIVGLFCSFGIRVPFSYIFSQLENTNLFILSLATPLSSVIQTILFLLFYVYLVKKLKKTFAASIINSIKSEK